MTEEERKEYEKLKIARDVLDDAPYTNAIAEALSYIYKRIQELEMKDWKL